MEYGWMLDSKCRGFDPELFTDANSVRAELMCAGCPVTRECAEFHLQPIDVTAFIERLTGVVLDEDVDRVFPSGVKAAGVDL